MGEAVLAPLRRCKRAAVGQFSYATSAWQRQQAYLSAEFRFIILSISDFPCLLESLSHCATAQGDRTFLLASAVVGCSTASLVVGYPELVYQGAFSAIGAGEIAVIYCEQNNSFHHLKSVK